MRNPLPVILANTLLCTLVLLVFPGMALKGQSKPVNRNAFRIQAKKTDQPVVIDGVLDESIWSLMFSFPLVMQMVCSIKLPKKALF